MNALTEQARFVELCDVCGSDSAVRAKTRAHFKTGVLMFCNHCYEEIKPQVLAQAISVETQERGSDAPPSR